MKYKANELPLNLTILTNSVLYYFCVYLCVFVCMWVCVRVCMYVTVGYLAVF